MWGYRSELLSHQKDGGDSTTCSEEVTRYLFWMMDWYRSLDLTTTTRKKAGTTALDSEFETATVTVSWTHCLGPGFGLATETWWRVVEKTLMRVIKLDMVNWVQRAGEDERTMNNRKEGDEGDWWVLRWDEFYMGAFLIVDFFKKFFFFFIFL